MTSATEILRRLLDECGVEWGNVRNDGSESDYLTEWQFEDNQGKAIAIEWAVGSGLSVEIHRYHLTPEQAIAATLGPTYKPDPVWEKWHKSLRHETVETVGDAVEQLMYEAIEFGGDMGPNGNVCDGIDEGDVLTSGFINKWIARFESTLGRDRYSYEQLREISNAVGDAMEYAHDRAIEHPDRADPLWSLDEYVNRILKVAFEGEATLGRGTCHDKGNIERFICSECGCRLDLQDDDWEATMWLDGAAMVPNFCPNCGRKVVDA